jgi:hypothetical protein
MTYPMMKFPTVGEFIQKTTQDHGARLRTTTSAVTGPRGPVVFRYLERPVDGVDKRTTPLPENDSEILSPDSLASFIRQLDLPAKAFGFTLGLPVSRSDDLAMH